MSVMARILLTLSLLLLLVAGILAIPTLFAVAVVSSIVTLTAVRGVPILPLIIFWFWINLVLFYLISEPSRSGADSGLILGIPMSLFWMLVGIGLVPVLIWPLAFFLNFRSWKSR
jgi:hypothetical protein